MIWFLLLKVFFEDPKILKGCNASLFTIIQKTLNPKSIKDFRPISLIGCQYEIIGKILDNRLSAVIN